MSLQDVSGKYAKHIYFLTSCVCHVNQSDHTANSSGQDYTLLLMHMPATVVDDGEGSTLILAALLDEPWQMKWPNTKRQCVKVL